MSVRPVPEGFHTVTPYLVVNDASGLLDYVKQAFGAKEADCMRSPDGTVRHADVLIGNSHVMMGQACEGHTATSTMLYLYVEDVDACFARAVEAGGEVVEELADKFYGDRTAAVRDTNGVTWYMATHVEDVPPDEMERRMEAEAAKQG